MLFVKFWGVKSEIKLEHLRPKIHQSMCGAVSRCQNSLSRLLRHLTRPMMGNISCLFWANQILAQVPPVFL